ncbi:MAG: flavodoxin family protein [Clostridium sp.]|nr:flavodoxin family protein [Clostridium sp.]
MNKRIVVLTGSPRKNGNSFAMTEAFVHAAEAKGHQVKRFDTAMMRVGGCHACQTCFQTGKACSFDDDFNRIAPEVETADAVVFTMPVYWYTMPAQIKAVIDKFYSFCVAGKEIAGKETALIACCEEDDMDVLSGVKFPYEKSIALLGWKSVGEVLVPGVNEPGDVKKTDGEKQAAALAEKF